MRLTYSSACGGCDVSLLREKSTDVTVELRDVSATASIGTVGTWVVPPPDLQIHVPAESLRLADAPPQIVISTAVPSTMAAIHEGWESTSSSSGYNPRHYGRNLRHHPAYGTTISQVILPLEGTKNESTVGRGHSPTLRPARATAWLDCWPAAPPVRQGGADIAEPVRGG